MKTIKRSGKISGALTILLSVLLSFTMMPVAAFGEAIVDGGKNEDGTYNKINSIQIKDDPYIYVNASDILGTGDLNQTTMYPLALYLMDEWSDIAQQIFDSKSVAPGHHSEGATWIWPDNSKKWADIFDNEDEHDSLHIKLSDWLKAEEAKKKGFNEGFNTDSGTYSTGIETAGSLAAIRNKIITEVAKGFPKMDDAEGKVRNYRGQDAILEDLKSDKATNAFYNIVVSHDESVKTNHAMNAYGVAIYDFELATILDDDLEYPNPKVKHGDGMDDNTFVSYSENKSSEDSSVSMELTTGTTQTLANTIEKSKSYVFGQELGSSTQIGLGFLGSGASETVEIKVTSSEAFGTAFSESGSVSKTVENKVGASVDLPAHTAVEIRETDGSTTDTISYDCPVAIRYKVAVFSLSHDALEGPIFGWVTDDHSGCDFCTIFGYGTSEGGLSAPENLYKRTQSGSNMENFGHVVGYVEKTKVEPEIKWGDSVFDSVETQIKNRATYIPLSTLANSTMKVDTYKKGNEVGDIVPLYKLASIGLAETENRDYDMTVGDEIRITSPKTTGLNDKGVEYYGFDPDDGHWVLSDARGNQIDASDVIDLQMSSVTKSLTMKAKKEGLAYLKYVLDDGIVYETKDGAKVSNDLNPPTSALIEVNVNPAPVINELEEYSIETKTTQTEGKAGEEINLVTAFNAKVVDEKDQIVASATKYELRDYRDASVVSISDTGIFVANKEGEYKVRAIYEKEGNEVRSEWLTVKVLPRRELNSFKVEDVETQIHSSHEGAYVTVKYADHTKFYDQYGDEWTGQTPALSAEVESNTGYSRVGGEYLYVDSCGKYGFIITAEGMGSEVMTVNARHNMSHIDRVEPSCTEEGRQERYHCSICQRNFADKEGEVPFKGNEYVIPATGHRWNGGVVTREASQTTEGEREYTCTVCGAKRTEAIARLPMEEQPMTVKVSKKTVKYKDLKKKAKTLTPIKVKNAQGNVSFKKLSGSSKLKINSKTGKVTVKKKTKSGNYSIKVRVSAAGNSVYEPGSKTITVKVRVKK